MTDDVSERLRRPSPVTEILSMSSPQSTSSRSSKPRRPPTVTPRRFNRFFDPRSSREHRSSSTQSSRALQQLTSAAINRSHNRDIDNGFDDFPVNRSIKRRKRSSTLSLTKNDVSLLHSDVTVPSSPPCFSISPEKAPSFHSSPCLQTRSPRSRYVTVQASSAPISRSRISQVLSPDYRNIVADFYTKPEDSHQYDYTCTPYCVAACNTNTLVVVGDENGSIRILESAKEGKPDFANPYITFQPHNNAIMHLSFSSDDRLLATASGDQTSQVIDMQTQTAIHTLTGSTSTVRQVVFQPGSDNVLATCSRDGSVNVYDIRSSKSAARIQTIPKAHLFDSPPPTSTQVTPHLLRPPATYTTMPSITSLHFLSPTRPHLFLTSSDTSSHLRLWDIRGRYTFSLRHSHSPAPTPLSTTAPPLSHQLTNRSYGITTLTGNTSHSLIYALCRDSTVYAYSANHVILGQAPELEPSTPAFKAHRGGVGAGPLYGFRNKAFRANTFYVRAAIRKADGRHDELLAVGSSDGCPVIFPTEERVLKRTERSCGGFLGGMQIYDVGTPLVRGHGGSSGYSEGKAPKEVTGAAWTTDGELLTVGDDCRVRCWREDGDIARGLRRREGGEAERWGCGWADVGGEWDEDDD